MSERNKFNFISSKVILEEDKLVFETTKFHLLRFWAARKNPKEILFEDITNCYIDDSGASHGFDSMRPHLIIEHKTGKTELAFKKSGIQPVEDNEGAEELCRKLNNFTDSGDIMEESDNPDNEGNIEETDENPQHIRKLKERFAEGEIDEEEYERKLEILKETENSLDKREDIDPEEKVYGKEKKHDKPTGSTIKEYKRTCNQCGNTWHSLKSREKKLQRAQAIDGCQEALNGCTCDHDASAQYEKNRQDAENELEKLRMCPECGSNGYDEEVIEIED